MIQVTDVKTPTTTFPKLQSELKPNSLYKDFEGDIHLTNRCGLLVGYFTTRNTSGESIFQLNRTNEERDISAYRLVQISATISFS